MPPCNAFSTRVKYSPGHLVDVCPWLEKLAVGSPAWSRRVPAPTHWCLNSLELCKLVAKPTGTLKSVSVGVFITQRLENTINHGFRFPQAGSPAKIVSFPPPPRDYITADERNLRYKNLGSSYSHITNVLELKFRYSTSHRVSV